MAKIISQQTFDDVVKENIVEFSMNVNEAKDETIKQFEAQGINLANIIKNLNINQDTGRPILTEIIEQLKATEDSEQMIKLLNDFTIECAISVPHRVMATKLGATEILLNILENVVQNPNDNKMTMKSVLIAWNELINGQPDIFSDKSLYLIIQILEQPTDDDLIIYVLQHLKHASLLHETNRQNIMNSEILKCLKPLLHHPNSEVTKETCAVFRHLILDDDIRVEFSKAHEHAKAIATEVLTDLTKLLPDKMNDKNMLAELILTLAALTVRHEYCVQIEEIGGINYIYECMNKHSNSIRVCKEALKLLRALAGNDAVKNHILQNDAAKVINEVINIHKTNEIFSRTALASLSTLTLRSKENSQLLFDVGIAETIVETMRLHKKSKIVQRNGAWAIRNIVSRSRDLCASFLLCGVEDILKEAMEKYTDVQYDIKSALRDLGCDVELKEEWIGIKNKIHIEN